MSLTRGFVQQALIQPLHMFYNHLLPSTDSMAHDTSADKRAASETPGRDSDSDVMQRSWLMLDGAAAENAPSPVSSSRPPSPAGDWTSSDLLRWVSCKSVCEGQGYLSQLRACNMTLLDR